MAAARDRSRSQSLRAGLQTFVRAIQEEDEKLLDAVRELSRSRRIFAPLALLVGALALLIEGMKILFTNWRLMLVQALPAFWIWLAMLDLKIHVLHGRSFHELRGWILLPIGLGIVALTTGSFFLNAVFAFAIAAPRPPKVRPAFAQARGHLGTIAVYGAIVGVCLAIATTVSPRWGPPWFTVTLGVMIGVMMVIYVAVPARLIGVERIQSRREKITTSMLSAALGATVCTPPYVMGRIGILMLGSRYLVIPGVLLLLIGLTLQAGATGAVRAIKLSAVLIAGRSADGSDIQPGGAPGE